MHEPSCPEFSWGPCQEQGGPWESWLLCSDHALPLLLPSPWAYLSSALWSVPVSQRGLTLALIQSSCEEQRHHGHPHRLWDSVVVTASVVCELTNQWPHSYVKIPRHLELPPLVCCTFVLKWRISDFVLMNCTGIQLTCFSMSHAFPVLRTWPRAHRAVESRRPGRNHHCIQLPRGSVRLEQRHRHDLRECLPLVRTAHFVSQ